MKTFILLMLIAAPGWSLGNEYTWTNTAMDYYVPENLMSLVKRADEKKEDDFLKNLRCWDTGTNSKGQILCEVEGTPYTYDYEIQDEYTPVSVLMTIPER